VTKNSASEHTAAPLSGQSESRKEAAERLKARVALCRRSLVDFHCYVNGWSVPDHQRRLCELWERIEQTPDARLIVTMPPRHGKTETELSALAWMLGRGQCGRGPVSRVALAMYGVELARGYAAQVRDQFDGYGLALDAFPTAYLASKSDTGWRFATQPAGRPSMIAVGVGGPFTGRGVDLLAIDDPIKTAEEARSETYRERHWRWWQQVARTRLQPGGRVVLTMTRWHEDDLAGRLIEQGGWEVIHLPALDDTDQALWPEQYPVKALEAIRHDIGAQAFEALYQGRPTPADGDVWRRTWFDANAYEEEPELMAALTAWDTAFKTSQSNDYTGWCRAGVDWRGHIYIMDFGRERLEFPDLLRYVEAGRGGDMSEVAVVEDAASGQSAIQALRSCSRGVIAMSADADKSARAKAVTQHFEAGKVHVNRKHPMYERLVGECTSFPFGRHDDMHDAMVHAVARLANSSSARAPRKLGVVG
jgi:predicted phage terminase large subunit-like protein